MSAPGEASQKAILYALLANGGIAIAKTFAAIFTGSGSMVAEAIHSYADCGNQLLLFLGIHRAKRPPTPDHPLGYGKAVYFWSFIVALMLFSLGGLFSIYEGLHKIGEHSELQSVWLALLVLGASIVLEAFSLYGALREIKKLRGEKSLLAWLKTSRNGELIVIFGEDVAALAGLVLAFFFLLLAWLLNNPVYDAIGSIAIGVILVIVSIFVAVRIKALLIGRSADPDIQESVRGIIKYDTDIQEVFNIITMQFGPQIMLAAKIQFRGGVDITVAAEKINVIELELKARHPEIHWSFIEPDTRA